CRSTTRRSARRWTRARWCRSLATASAASTCESSSRMPQPLGLSGLCLDANHGLGDIEPVALVDIEAPARLDGTGQIREAERAERGRQQGGEWFCGHIEPSTLTVEGVSGPRSAAR